MGKTGYIEGVVSHGAETVTYLKAYVQKQIELQKLEATEKVSETGAALSISMIAILVGTMALLFLSIALAIWLGTLLGSRPLGFACTGGFYIIVMGFLQLFRGPFRRSVQDGIIAFLNRQADA